MFSAGTSSINGGDDGFFSNVAGSVEQGLSTIGSELLPIWAAQQLGIQSKPAVDKPNFDPAAAPPRINDGMQTTAGPAVTVQVQSAKAMPDKIAGVPTPVVLVGGIVGLVLIGAFLLRGR